MSTSFKIYQNLKLDAWKMVANKAEGRISKQVLQKNKGRKILR